MNKNFEKHLLDLKIFSPVSNAFPLTKTKLPLNKILLLVFKRVLILILKRVYQFEIISQVRYQFEKLKF
jgi:hypothetical protein